MKKSLFFENAKLLSDKFGIVPLMYGSLGLEYITGENLSADDIDILIPEKYLLEEWESFKAILSENGYTLIDEHEHTFIKNEIACSYAAIEDLEGFADVKLSDIVCKNASGVSFLVLSLEQYLKVYAASSKDGYRINVRSKKDNEKIAFIEKLLKADNG